MPQYRVFDDMVFSTPKRSFHNIAVVTHDYKENTKKENYDVWTNNNNDKIMASVRQKLSTAKRIPAVSEQ